MNNKKLYDDILNGRIDENLVVKSLGYIDDPLCKTDIYFGSSSIIRTYLCEDTSLVPNKKSFVADVLIIAGGGGGGTGQGGGGGGGGYREFTKKYFTGINYTVTIGAGGSANSNGSNSNIERIADGGGAGGNAWGSTQEACNGKDGGSGGGTGLTSNISFRNTYGGNSLDTRCNGSSQGYPAESGPAPILSSGGAGGTGSSQNGGPGKTSNITGTSVGRGGGGACGFGSGTATDGGGAPYTAGTVNTGGGGGGGGANGGSGFVVIKFPSWYSITIGGGLTYTTSTSNGYTTVQFTAGTDTISFASYNPKNVSNLQLWLDAADCESITLNGGTVSQWDDKSGNNYHMTQTTASQQPTLKLNHTNGYDSIYFDGTNDIFNNTGIAIDFASNPTGLNNFTFFGVFKATGVSGGTNMLGFGSSSSASMIRIGYGYPYGIKTANNFVIFGDDAGGPLNSYESCSFTDTKVYRLEIHSSGLKRSFCNGSTTSLDYYYPTAANDGTTFDNFTIGGVITPSTTGYGGFYLSELLIYSGILASGDITNIETYLIDKWGT